MTDDDPIHTHPPAARAVLAACWLTAAAVMTVYVFRAGPTTYLLDSSELVATTFALGVSHPPGHPAFHLLSYGFTALPLGSVAFRVHLAVALTSACALGLLPAAAWRLGWLRSRGSLAVASLVALALAFTPAFAQQSIRAEVYALHALVVAAATVVAIGADERTRTARSVGAAVALGVGLANHHYLTVFAFPAFAWAIVSGPGGGRLRRVALGCATGLSMLVAYAYLPLRAARMPAASWGWPDDPGEIAWIVSAQAFQKTAGRAVAMDPVQGAVNVIGVLIESLTIPGFLAAAAGLILLTLRERRIAAFLGLGIAANLATQLLFDFDPMNPDALGYFMAAYWWLGLALVFLLGHIDLPGAPGRHAPLLRSALAVALVAGTAWSARAGGRTVNLEDNWDSELLRDEALNGIDPDGAWVTAYYETGFNTWYATVVEDRRPDVAHVHQAFLTYPFYREMLEQGAPRAAALVGDDTLLDTDALIELAATSEVRIEAEQLVPLELAARSVPTRLYLRLMPEPLPEGTFPPSLAREVADNVRAVRTRFADPLETQTARNLLWAEFNLAGQMCRAGRLHVCRDILSEALLLAPDDPDLRAFAADVDRRLRQQP